MQAAKWLRSWLISRCSRGADSPGAAGARRDRRHSWRCAVDSAALMISMPLPSSMPRFCALWRIGSSRPTRSAVPSPCVHEARGGADHLLLLALREHDALGRAPQPLEHLLQHARDRIAPRLQRVAVGLHVGDRLARHAGVHRGLRHRGRHMRDQPRIERHRDDVVRSELRPRAIGGGDLVGHVLAGELGERAGGGDLHLHVDGGGAHVERAAEDVGKAQHVVDLVRIVRAAGRHDGVVAHLGDLLGGDLGIGIGHGEDDRLLRHRGDHVLGHRALGGQAEEHVGAFHASASVRAEVFTACADFHWFMPSVRPS